jgi:hypothetical protein
MNQSRLRPTLVTTSAAALEPALARVEAIVPDSNAGRARRDPVHPAIEAVAENLTRPNRILLTELLAAGLLTVEVIDLTDTEAAKLGDGRFVTRVRLRWRRGSSPLARAARAVGAHLQASGVDLATVALMPRSVLDEQHDRWAVD